MAESYPEVASDWARISQIAYARRMHSGAPSPPVLRSLTSRLPTPSGSIQAVLSSDRAFQLHDTYGFPIDLTLEMAAEQGLSVDEAGFRRLMQEQKDRAKADAKSKKAGAQAVEIYRELRALGPTPFTGYTELPGRGPWHRRRRDAFRGCRGGRPRRGCAGADAVLRRIGGQDSDAGGSSAMVSSSRWMSSVR